ncbi:MAG TPA: ribonuclease Y [Egibacteraceae bacterium]|nr:ribonuclease Y [Egibacteraceae bacterium]
MDLTAASKVGFIAAGGLAVFLGAVVFFTLRMRGTVHRVRDELAAERDRLERRLAQVEQRDERVARREETVEVKSRTLELREGNLLDRERTLAAEQAELDDALIAQRKRLEEIANFTADEARQGLIEATEAEARSDALSLVRDIEARAREEAELRARMIVATAVQRVAVDTAGSTVATTVQLPDDDLKGRIIGREGRNIRAFEQATGVSVVIDEAPDSVLLSCFDPVRREVARVALTALLADGRIHPASIEAEHARAERVVEAGIIGAGQAAAAEASVTGLTEELLRLLGALRYRTSYGQDVLRHSVESAFIAGLIADELGTDAPLARRCALLHDIGKALTHEAEGSHAAVGAAIAARHGEADAVCHAIAAHHGEVEQRTIEAVLTQTADAISAARPGARRDAHEHYVTRLRRTEELCLQYAGVDRAYAMQSGRDVRVMVCPDVIDDAGAKDLAKKIAGRIESELQYPGQITVTVVRELRARHVAR